MATKKTKLTEPDTLDKAMVEKEAKAKPKPTKKRAPGYLKKSILSHKDRVKMITEFNSVFSAQLPLTTTCGGSLRAVQRRLKVHHNIK